ncbi:type II toxin-antitoxin system HicB family antitoxin [Enterococcus cecorum]|uniref:type II toxin-antitoxin system HicB family antitoxin n=1 Tax=Enterococcus cecorum TaxID=44008 RepID=UPI001FA67E01|nr:type II toxin-antitoxin system HicB family antitoxin [Enterococcus cecorum]HJD15648.1 type II toxin-antitoxin system HicB family antitoxin [Candidatus Enterococcus stercoripullorum]MCJ0538789.1 type II toxin-antitoxin system HicB family antitoxin [Enterococcus cecorum]MCJ0547182.1 type II toxin-antitoxin system HicB family antitoxin [Enterococcus cecorum]MCJ0550309.1 type II toxin-antitoxin system HicB family antitoxin [Enterococcus cecorum]MCJ0570320.1 type II toxin-antitoxin system HicB f
MIKVYSAVFEQDPVGYGIYFPDIEGAVTQGTTIEEGIDNASDALGMMLADLIENEIPLPQPTNINEIKIDENTQFKTLISVDLADYLKETKLDKKTVKIPHWLNVRAIKANVNFSKTLSDALIEKLGV